MVILVFIRIPPACRRGQSPCISSLMWTRRRDIDKMERSEWVLLDFRKMAATLTPGLSEVSALLAVLDRKSYTKAAQQLGLSPARISELVRNLEERIGVRLVERTTRSVAATVAGEWLLGRLRPLLEEYQAAFDSLNDFRTSAAGTLRLTVPPPAADFVLAP